MVNAAIILTLTLFLLIGFLIFLVAISKRNVKHETRRETGMFERGALVIDLVNNFVSEVESFQRRWDGWFDISFVNGYRFPYHPKSLMLANLPAITGGGQPILVHGSIENTEVNAILKDANEAADKYLREMEDVRLHNIDEIENVERLLKSQRKEVKAVEG